VKVARGLDRHAKIVGKASAIKHVCLENFGPVFRDAVPEIGGEFPTDYPLEKALPLAIRTLTATGVIG